MSKRNYNVFFNTHTVSGIVISVALYIIFFAGAFALFRAEIIDWEQRTPPNKEIAKINYDTILDSLANKKELESRDILFSGGNKSRKDLLITINASKDSLAPKNTKKRDAFFLNTDDFSLETYQRKYTLGEFLYRLHFFHQLPTIGIYLAGFVSLFFLFAIVTGVIVHWKKIIPNFYSFNPKIALKRVWTDAHTALGVIGLPFQFMYAVTGAFYCLSLFVLLPANILYGNDQDKLMADIRPEFAIEKWENATEKEPLSLNAFVEESTANWNEFTIQRVMVKNYGGTNMQYTIVGEIPDSEHFLTKGIKTVNALSGEVEFLQNPKKMPYMQAIMSSMGRLHFASFGGVFNKIIYFILALVTCFVIITGVLIWVEARNKKSMTLKQRLYTAKVGHIYLAICLSMLPVTALSFIVVKLLPENLYPQKAPIIYSLYFLSWLVFIFYYRFKRNNYFTNKSTLLLGAILGFLIPVVNGFVSDNWLWNSFQHHEGIFTIDILWIGISSIALYTYYKIKPQAEMQSSFNKYPIDYKNLSALKTEENKIMETLPITEEPKTSEIKNSNIDLPMKTKIIFLWLFLAIGWIVHHIYGLFNVYYSESLMMEGATGDVPVIHHIYRILFEGLCLLFALFTIEVSKKWFVWTSLVWAIIAGLYNIIHFFEAIVYESSNISEIFMLLLVSIASVFLVINLNKWRKA